MAQVGDAFRHLVVGRHGQAVGLREGHRDRLHRARPVSQLEDEGCGFVEVVDLRRRALVDDQAGVDLADLQIARADGPGSFDPPIMPGPSPSRPRANFDALRILIASRRPIFMTPVSSAVSVPGRPLQAQ